MKGDIDVRSILGRGTEFIIVVETESGYCNGKSPLPESPR